MAQDVHMYINLLKNITKKSNDILFKVIWCFIGVEILLLLGILTQVYRVSEVFVLKWIGISTVLAVIITLLRLIKISEEYVKYAMVFAIQISILWGMSEGTIDIKCLFIIPAIASMLYMDKKLTVIACISSYVCLLIGLYNVSSYRVEHNYTTYSPKRWFIAFALGYTLEFCVICFAIYVALKRVSNVMNSLEKENEKVITIQSDVISGFAGVVESRDSNENGHVKRTTAVVKLILDSIEENKIYTNRITINEAKIIQMAAPLYDIGKIVISDEILCKPAKLESEEFDEMIVHTEEGREIIDIYLSGMEDKEIIERAKEMALSHHERWDGTGYPSKLKGEEIPISARIMAVADVFDALVTERCYKNVISFEEAINEIMEDAGKQFDSEIVRAFVLKKDKVREIYDEIGSM